MAKGDNSDVDRLFFSATPWSLHGALSRPTSMRASRCWRVIRPTTSLMLKLPSRDFRLKCVESGCGLTSMRCEMGSVRRCDWLTQQARGSGLAGPVGRGLAV